MGATTVVAPGALLGAGAGAGAGVGEGAAAAVERVAVPDVKVRLGVCLVGMLMMSLVGVKRMRL